jgi:transposase-like protein
MANQFNAHFKIDTVGLVGQGRSISEVPKTLDIELSTLDKWVRSVRNEIG